MADKQKDIRVNLTTSFTTSTLKLVFLTATTVVAKQAIRTVFKIEDDVSSYNQNFPIHDECAKLSQQRFFPMP